LFISDKFAQQKYDRKLAKRKLERFAQIATFNNVYEHPQRGPLVEDFHLKGKWKQECFGNNNPIVLELGCGKGEYTVGMAQNFPQKNFIGADLKGNRIWRGAKEALEAGFRNVAFIRTRIENIESIFAKNEISEIWLTFPDPQPQSAREKKRLTAMPFLNRYKNILSADGIIHLKTDSAFLYEYTLDVIKQNKLNLIANTNDLYANTEKGFEESLFSIKTFYEKKFTEKGFKICYLKFRL